MFDPFGCIVKWVFSCQVRTLAHNRACYLPDFCGMSTAVAQKFYKFKAEAAGESTLDIFGDIASWWGQSVQMLAYDLYGRTDDLRVRVDSAGGDLLQGIAMGNMLKGYPGKVTVEVIGLVASAATMLAAGANRVEMHQGSFYMIHNPATLTGGDATTLESDAAALRKMEDEMASVYVAQMKKRGKMLGMTDEEATSKVKEWMNAETWFTSSEAVEHGFADEVIGVAESVTDDTYTATASPIYAKYKNAPKPGGSTNDMSKDKKGFFAALTQLVAQYTASDSGATTSEANADTADTAAEKTTTTTTAGADLTDDQLLALVAERGLGGDADGDGADSTTDTNNDGDAEVYTAAQVAEMIAKATKATKAASNPVKQGDTAPPLRGEKEKQKLTKALAPMAKAFNRN